MPVNTYNFIPSWSIIAKANDEANKIFIKITPEIRQLIGIW